MRNRLFIIAVLAIGMAACFGSCKKKTVEPTSDPTSTEEYICAHDSLVFVAPVEPTEEENGCIAHYVCGRCGATFADASATTPVENTILWATSYAFDNDNIIEKDFARWVGDEPYLLRACRGKLSSNSWENWTDAQWEEYWGEINELYYEWGGQEQFDVNAVPLAAGIFSDFMGKIFKNTKLDSVVKNIMPFFEEDGDKPQWDKINARLDTIMRKLDDIQNSINALTDLVKTDRYRNVMQQRYEKQVGLMNLTYDYFNPILRLIAAENKPYDSLSADAKEKIKNLTEAWHNTPVGGTNPELQMMNMLQFMKGDFVTESTLPKVYDYIAYHDAPWEHQAYTFREMTRTADVVVMAECYLMNLMYYETHREETYNHPTNGPTFIHQFTINILMSEYAEILKNDKIVYHDHMVCQIPGAEVNVKKELRKLEPYEYIKNRELYLNNNDQMENFRKYMLPNGGVNKGWPSVVYQYYAKNYTVAESDTKFLYDKLKSAGFTNIPTNEDDWIVTDCDCKWHAEMLAVFDNSNFVVKMLKYFTHDTESGEDYISFHTAINKKNGSLTTSQAIRNMNIKNGSHRIDKIGDKINNREFYAIELHK